MLFADALRIPEAQQVIMVWFLSFSLLRLAGNWSTGIFTDALICPDAYSPLLLTSSIKAPCFTNSARSSFVPSPNKFQQLKYKEVNGYYKIKIAIIPKQKGTYYVGVGNGLSNGRGNSKTCEKAGFIITLSNTNQHFNYFNDWHANSTLTPFEKPRAYFMKDY